MKRALIVPLCLLLAGCATDLEVEKIDQDHYLLTDDGNGSNPEKGLNVCARENRYVDTWRKAHGSDDDAQIIVTCGPKRER